MRCEYANYRVDSKIYVVFCKKRVILHATVHVLYIHMYVRKVESEIEIVIREICITTFDSRHILPNTQV